MARDIESFKAIDDAKKLFSRSRASPQGIHRSPSRSSTDSEFIAEAEKEIDLLTREKTRQETRLEGLLGTESKLAGEYDGLKSAIEKEKDTDRDAEKDVFRIIARQNEVRHIVNDLSAKLLTLSHEEETFKRELGEAGNIAGREAVEYEKAGEREKGIKGESRTEQEERRKKIEKLKVRLEDSGGAGGSEVMKEYRETEERDAFLARELDDLHKAGEELRKLIAELDVRLDLEFKTGILKINTEFNSYFTMMFGGGKAELAVVREARRRRKGDLEDLGDIMSPSRPEAESSTSSLRDAEDFAQGQGGATDGPEGLEVNVSLPRKKVKGLMMLSGGERALTSIALLFAISQVNPPPFIILDETDAALDEANSRKYGDMIEDLSRHSQLILITHNRETMSRAGVLYGVTMGSDGASKLLSIQFEEAVKVAK